MSCLNSSLSLLNAFQHPRVRDVEETDCGGRAQHRMYMESETSPTQTHRCYIAIYNLSHTWRLGHAHRTIVPMVVHAQNPIVLAVSCIFYF